MCVGCAQMRDTGFDDGSFDSEEKHLSGNAEFSSGGSHHAVVVVAPAVAGVVKRGQQPLLAPDPVHRHRVDAAVEFTGAEVKFRAESRRQGVCVVWLARVREWVGPCPNVRTQSRRRPGR
jgi:hypothetical protein